MAFRTPILVLLWLLVIGATSENVVKRLADSYEEQLTVNRLKSGQIYSHFRFAIDNPNSNAQGSYELFPRILDEIAKKYKVRDLQLSLTQGFWRTSQWGLQPKPETPNGAQLVALFDGDSEKEINQRWTFLVNSLNGIFCTSLMELVPALTASPHWFLNDILEEHGNASKMAKNIRYGVLGGETVCTENLTPWKKLLPCKQNGIVQLLNPTKLYSSVYHSLTLRVKQNEKGRSLEMTAGYLADLPVLSKEKSWNFRKLYDRVISGQCVVAAKSEILVGKEEIADSRFSQDPDEVVTVAGQDFLRYDLTKLPLKGGFNLAMQTRAFLQIQAPPQTFFGMHSFLSNVGLQNGQIRHRLTNLKDKNLPITFTHMVPWFLRVFMHTIAIECEPVGAGERPEAHIARRHYQLAVDREKPALMELQIELPKKSVCVMSVDYETAFMRAQEFHPDANYGNYIPGAVVSFKAEEEDLLANVITPTWIPKERILVYGETLLIQLPTPDFSMPFNVLCLVSTVISIFYGPIHGLTTKIMKPCLDTVPERKTLLRKLIELIITVLKKVKSMILKKKKKKSEGEEEDKEKKEE
ncbi:hypothetical protein L596_025465 [Steinernema carpocapsae]|uniref:GPI transamidase component PIG-T n=1 Tax=Steinernema carpocapsae TaxID=34508 RepID=A0A4U5M7U4_STECR|nr:hypothetical protein L596_025465 [Steinernema carpocapsae]